MTSKIDEYWVRSVGRVLRSMTFGGVLRLDPQGLTLLREQLVLLRTKIPVRWPIEPIAMHSVDNLFVSGRDDTLVSLRVYLMVQRGYPLPEAMLFWRNLRFAIAEDINPHAMQLWTRDQIIETLGGAFGGPVADAIADPRSNATLHALLYKQHGMSIYRPAAFAWLDVTLGSDFRLHRSSIRMTMTEPFGVVNGTGPTEGTPLTDLTATDAEQLYTRLTEDGIMDFTFYLDPSEIDYAAEAEKAQKALWEADRDRDSPFTRRAPTGERYLPVWP